jgi:hypothetical protein
MEKFTREELVAKAVAHFEKLKEENSVLACEDGQFFLDNATSRGQLATHCKELDLEFYEIDRAEVGGKSSKKEAVIDFAKMNKAQLTAVAQEKGITIPEGATNKEIVALLTAEPGTEKGTESAAGEAANSGEAE